jgi:hypothetical protein
MSQNTHELPKHLGGWPCRLLKSAPVSDGKGNYLELVEYEDDQGETQRIWVNPEKLTRIVPAEPDAPYVVGPDGRVYRRQAGTEPGTSERLWRDSGIGTVRTWAQWCASWDESDFGTSVVALVEDPFAELPELPFTIRSYDSVTVEFEDVNRVRSTAPVKLMLVDNWTWCSPHEAEAIGWALIAAARIAQKRETP